MYPEVVQFETGPRMLLREREPAFVRRAWPAWRFRELRIGVKTPIRRNRMVRSC